MEQHQKIIAEELGVGVNQVAAVASLLEEGATVPFIARYRKEASGSLDEVQITAIRDRLTQLRELDKRRDAILESLTERDLLTEELEQNIMNAPGMAVLEDIYMPYRPKRRTRAAIARERGLEPLADAILEQSDAQIRPVDFIDPEKEVNSEEEALAGARDIIAERINEDAETRAVLRDFFEQAAVVNSFAIEKSRESSSKFKDYFDYSESAAQIPGHRLLAMLRGEKEKALILTVLPPEEKALEILRLRHLKNDNFSGEQVDMALEDAYQRLLAPSLENESRGSLKERADKEAIGVFAENLRELLLSPPLGQKRIMALDPGFRTGSKLVCLDAQGKPLEFTTIYPTHSERQIQKAGKITAELCEKYKIEAIAIGNGTASRETEAFVRGLKLSPDIIITMVNESGASIYSASESARKEFPDYDITARGAISIGRRLQDPLAELVKIDPKSIGVGQYQHDVDQKALKQSLDDVAESCVNSVGAEVNTASLELLVRVSGLGPALAQNIVSFRNEHGPFASRQDLLKVPRLGPKAFEQCAGFLRIHGAANPLDGSAVHPERYHVVERMASDSGVETAELIKRKDIRQKIDIRHYVSDSAGIPTLTDIMKELAKPGRDPRKSFARFSFAEEVNSIEDIHPGMILPGIIVNVAKFGAFVDVGVHQDGLVHISQLSDRFVKDPSEVVKVGQQVIVRVLETDPERKRISLSLRDVENEMPDGISLSPRDLESDIPDRISLSID